MYAAVVTYFSRCTTRPTAIMPKRGEQTRHTVEINPALPKGYNTSIGTGVQFGSYVDADYTHKVTDRRSCLWWSCDGCWCLRIALSLGCRRALRFLVRKQNVANGEFDIVHVPPGEHADSVAKPLHTEVFLSFACRWRFSREGGLLIGPIRVLSEVVPSRDVQLFC